MGETLKRRAAAYGLLLPGTAWLVVFFLVPLYFLGRLSLNVNLGTYYPFDWHWQNYSDALSLYDTQFLRSFLYSGLATLICTSTKSKSKCSATSRPRSTTSNRAS